MRYLLDTVTVVRHFSETGSIGKSAAHILDRAEDDRHELLISVISLMEILYLSEKKRIPINLNDTFQRIFESSLYAVVDLTPDILDVAQRINFSELHDRLILATAKWLDVPVISSDRLFMNFQDIVLIWD